MRRLSDSFAQLNDVVRSVSDLGGITPCKKLATLCEFFGVKTAWHGPGACSPVAMMANLALDLSSSNFGVQEYQLTAFQSEAANEVFPGFGDHKIESGMMWPASNPRPGLGLDIDEDAAARYGWTDGSDRAEQQPHSWPPVRDKAGGLIYP